MDDEEMNYWQVAAGDGERDYSEVFLKYGVMLIGPGDPGEYFDNKDYYDDKDRYKPNDVRYFVEQVKEGDIVVLKRPSGKLWEVLAIGTVESGYVYSSAFDDVEGWDLQHCRRVKWVKSEGWELMAGLARGTFKRIDKKDTIQRIDELLKSGVIKPPEQIPEPAIELDDEDLIDDLIRHGLRPKDAEEFTQTIQRIRRLVKWYYSSGEDVKEHETRTFLIVPLLLALGWSEQRLKIEWKNVDIAFFERPYTKKDDECGTILESKKLWAGLSPAEGQVKGYADKHPKCKKLIVTDGCCYKLFERNGGDWDYSAYLNILKPKRIHPYEPTVGGAPDVFKNLMYK
jgi:hypothetical protein